VSSRCGQNGVWTGWSSHESSADSGGSGVAEVNPPLVSVLIPTYNHARYVRRCLDSLLEEGWPNLEVLIIDDGSSDESFTVIQEWRSQHQNAFYRFDLDRQTNRGLAATLNILIGKASGRYIKILASDDYLIRKGIQAGVDYLQKNNDKLAVFGDCLVVDENDRTILRSGLTQFLTPSIRPRVMSYPKLIPLEIILRWSILGPGLLLRSEAYTQPGIGLYNELLLVEDRDMYLRLTAKAALGYVDQSVAAYRWHGDNQSRLDDPRRKEHEFALAVAAQTNAKNFNGLERMALQIDSMRWKTGQWKTSKDMNIWFLAIFSRIFWRFIHLLHDFRVSFAIKL
jgi:glycosyltransferase involved in cell wall biosynthesis